MVVDCASGEIIGLNRPPPLILIATPFPNPTLASTDQSSQFGILESIANVLVSKALATVFSVFESGSFLITFPSISNVPEPCPSV